MVETGAGTLRLAVRGQALTHTWRGGYCHREEGCLLGISPFPGMHRLSPSTQLGCHITARLLAETAASPHPTMCEVLPPPFPCTNAGHALNLVCCSVSDSWCHDQADTRVGLWRGCPAGHESRALGGTATVQFLRRVGRAGQVCSEHSIRHLRRCG